MSPGLLMSRWPVPAAELEMAQPKTLRDASRSVSTGRTSGQRTCTKVVLWRTQVPCAD